MNNQIEKVGSEKKEIETCCICREEAVIKCSHCDNPYCIKHYGTTVMTGNCCSDNEKDYE